MEGGILGYVHSSQTLESKTDDYATVQVPLLCICLVLIFTFVRYTVPGQGKSKREMISRIDYGGSFSLIIGLGSLLFALSFKNNDNLPWEDPLVYGPLILSAVFTIVFVLVEAFYALEPVMLLRILRQRNGIFVSLINFFLSMVSFSVLYFFPIIFEVVMGKTASQAGGFTPSAVVDPPTDECTGAHLLPNAVALSFGSLLAGWVRPRVHPSCHDTDEPSMVRSSVEPDDTTGSSS
jgi:hypothetical protein